MTAHKVRNNIFKIVAWFIGIILLLLFAFHIWFINYAEKAIGELVNWKSQGKLNASVKKMRIDYFNNKVEIKEIAFFNTDTLGQATSYRFATKELRFTILSKWNLVFHKKLAVDTIIFTAPDITLTRRDVPKVDVPTDTTKKKIELAEELGNIYKTINQALTVLNLKCFRINDGRVIVKDANVSGKPPFLLSHIYFSVNKLAIDSADKDSQGNFLLADDIRLRVGAQVIQLQDGKSNIGFSELLIDSKQRLILVSNPSVHLYPAPGKGTIFSSTMQKLSISGLDFNTLYTQPLIKIDSVYMESGVGDIQIRSNAKKKKTDAEKKRDEAKKAVPIDEAIRHLPVAISINHVVISNGSGQVHLYQGLKSTLFQSKNDNLNLYGVHVNDTTKKALVIRNFTYTLRNYSGYTPDSIYRYRFDSLQFVGNKIVLFNFVIQTLRDDKTNTSRNHIIPRFEITDMDWMAFLLHNEFKASSAVMYDPVFNVDKRNVVAVKKSVAPVGKKQSIYQLLSSFGNLIALNEVKIVNGQFNASAGQNASSIYHINKINLDINIKEVTESKSTIQLLHSIKVLAFDSAIAITPGMELHISKSNLSTDHQQLLLKKILLATGNNNIAVDLDAVAINDFSFDQNELEVNGISWQKGNIHIAEQAKKLGEEKKAVSNNKPASKGLALLVHHILANNTAVFFGNEKMKAHVFLTRLAVNSLGKPANEPLQINGLAVAGNNAQVDLQTGQILCKEFTLKDEQPSMFQNISFQQNANGDTVSVKIPSLTFVPFINKILATNAIVLDSVKLHQPDIFLSSTKKKSTKISTGATANLPLNLPNLQIKGFYIDKGTFHLASTSAIERTVVDAKQIDYGLQSVATQTDKSILINGMALSAMDISFNKNNRLLVGSDGKMNMAISKASFNPATQDWQMNLDELKLQKLTYKNGQTDSNHTDLLVEKINLQQVSVSNTDLMEPLAWLINKSNATVSMGFIHLQSSGTNLQVRHFLLDGLKNTINIDSVSMDPGQAPDYFMAHLVTRKDYMTMGSGKIIINGLSYTNKLFHIANIQTTNGRLKIYSDKFIKPAPNNFKEQPLLAAALKKINADLQIDKVQLQNFGVVYAELNLNSKRLGTINFTNMYGNVLNVITKPQPASDSLRVNINAMFLDALPLHLAMNESYQDPLGGLTLQLQLGHGDLRLLNPFLGDLVSVQIKNGHLDSMSLAAQGNDRQASGKMLIYYQGIKAQILDSGNLHHSKFKTKIINAVANGVVIRKNNDHRLAEFEFYRDKQKSIIDYFLKMVIQGSEGNVVPTISKILQKKLNKKFLLHESEQAAEKMAPVKKAAE